MSVTESVPSKLPEVVGVKVTLMIQLACDARVEPQVVASAKLAVAEMLTMLSAAVPSLLKVTDCAGLALPTISLPKVRVVGDNLAAGAGVLPPVAG